MKRVLLLLAVVASILWIGTIPTVTATDNPKFFVCKYVGTPGVDERLQTGNNPISVAGAQLPQPVVIGTFFTDSQGRSYILAEDVGQPEPDPSECPPPDAPPSPTPVPPTPTPVPPTPTPVPPTPTPVPPTPTPTLPPVASQFSVEPAACRFAGDDTRLRFRVIAGIILLSQVDIFIDGNLIDRNDITIVDGEAFIVVEPGLRAWTIEDEVTGEVLASGETICPTCLPVVTPPPPPAPTASPKPTVPPTDTE